MRFSALFLLIASLVPAPSAHASSGAMMERLTALFARPTSRIFLFHTSEGAIFAERVLGHRVTTDQGMTSLARRIARNEKLQSQVIARLEQIETMLGQEIHGLRATRFAERVSEHVATFFALRPGEGAAIEFANALPYGANRLRFVEPTAPRLRSWIGESLGDLGGVNLRGADLRGSFVTQATNLKGAEFDQFTALPFSRSEALRRGMRYRLSFAPETSMWVDLEAATEMAAAAGAEAPEEALKIPRKLMKELGAYYGEEAEHITLLSRPDNVSVRGTSYVKFEAGTYNLNHPNGEIAALAKELHEAGGELRWVVLADPVKGVPINSSSCYFRLEGRKPVIGISTGTQRPTLHHERTHFRDFVNVVKKYRAQGMSEDAAFEAASTERATAKWVVFTERNAVRNELKAQAALDDEAGLPMAERRWRFEQRRFAATLSYPEREGIRRVFKKHELEEIVQDEKLSEEASGYFRVLFKNVLRARRTRFLNMEMENAARVSREELFQEAIATNVARYAEDGSLEAVRAFAFDRLPHEIARLPDDGFRRALEAHLLQPGP